MTTSWLTLDRCANCGSQDASCKKCGACLAVAYCDRECQSTHRALHREECDAVVAMRRADDDARSFTLAMQRAEREVHSGRHVALYERAMMHGVRAVDAYKSLGPRAFARTASALVNLAECSHQLGRVAEALDRARRAEAAANDDVDVYAPPPLWLRVHANDISAPRGWKGGDVAQVLHLFALAHAMHGKVLCSPGGFQVSALHCTDEPRFSSHIARSRRSTRSRGGSRIPLD